ncbi:MAG: type IX secretion system sortase PorU [Bacteroidales bacterium]
MKIHLLFGSILFTFMLSAQEVIHSRQDFTLNWDKWTNTDDHGNISVSYYFDGSINHADFGIFPVLAWRIPVQSLKAQLKTLEIHPLEVMEIPVAHLGQSDKLPHQYDYRNEIVEISGQRYLQIEVLPMRWLEQTTGYTLVEFLKFLSLEATVEDFPLQASSQPKASVSAILQSGMAEDAWYKIKIPQSGIYKLSYNDLQAMGINLAGLDPRNLRMHGNGGGILPEGNNIERLDDIREMAIEVVGENDGRFDPGDYIIFYAGGPDTWTYNDTEKRFNYIKNPYSDFAYCFLVVGTRPGLRISNYPVPETPVNYTLTQFTDRYHYEKDLVQLTKSGRQWYGELFDVQTSYDFNLSLEGVETGSRVWLKSAVVARSFANSVMKVSMGGTPLLQQSIGSVPTSGLEAEFAKRVVDTVSFKVQGKDLKIAYNYLKPITSSQAWLDYFTVNWRRSLSFSNGQMAFRQPWPLSTSEAVMFRISNVPSNLEVWDITDPTRPMSLTLQNSGNIAEFITQPDKLREFIAFDGTSFLTPEYIGPVANQNLHGMADVDYIIITHSDFLEQAHQLAEMHRQMHPLRVEVVTPEMVYNEFSSGAQDPTAIRDFMRHLRRVSQNKNKPAYLLLFGDASYDYKDRLPNNTNFVPTYQSVETLNPVYTFATDDYYVLLDSTEGKGAVGIPDMAVGRIPVTNKEQATSYLEKLQNYLTNSDQTMGDWRVTLCFVADDEDGNTHLRQANELADYVNTNHPVFQINKIYLDAYDQVTTPGGQRYPEVTQAINQQVNSGALLINYTGHGGETGWAHERILEVSDINAWKNFNHLPLFVTATCEFSRYDDPQRVSAGEYVFLNPAGGGIALFTTARLTFGGSNITLNRSFIKYLFSKSQGKYPTLGQAVMKAKQEGGSDLNGKKFILLGDPALTLAYPDNNVNALTINGVSVDIPSDTLKALSQIVITGEVTNPLNYHLYDFEGSVTATVYDKESLVKTKGNDPGSIPTTFSLRKNVVYKGKAVVKDGNFTFSFIVPKDIEYKFGYGKINFYAQSEVADAAGYFSRIVVGGVNKNAGIDETPPVISLFMNDLNFRDGGITDENPVLLARLSDESGINTVGSGIGHDIVAILDDDTRHPIILNQYYTSDVGTYTSGTVKHPFKNLSEGEHVLRLTAWDVYNNSSSATLRFVVKNSSTTEISRFYNYPNPFSYNTWFVFEHNQAGGRLEALIEIFDLSGRKVRTLQQTIALAGYRNEPIPWDGRTDSGALLPQGFYMARLTLTDDKGNIMVKSTRLIKGGDQ